APLLAEGASRASRDQQFFEGSRNPSPAVPVMGFFMGVENMKPQFDISGDLDTPVSAYLKLAAFQPRFLLESVEGGERLGRFSFIGFGDCLEVKLDRDGFRIGNERRPVPKDSAELFAGLRDALARS